MGCGIGGGYVVPVINVCVLIPADVINISMAFAGNFTDSGLLLNKQISTL